MLMDATTTEKLAITIVTVLGKQQSRRLNMLCSPIWLVRREKAKRQRRRHRLACHLGASLVRAVALTPSRRAVERTMAGADALECRRRLCKLLGSKL